MKKYNHIFAIVLLAGVIFAIFRLINLNSIPVFVDEAIYVRWSQVMKNEATLRFLPLSDGKQPLSMWLTIPFLKVFTDPLIAGRFVSVLAGLGSFIGLIFLTKILFNNFTIAAISALIYSVLPFTVFFDRMALADSLLAMFGIWSISLSILFSKTQQLDHAMMAGFAIGGGLITKSPAIFFYLWLALCIVFFAKNKDLKSYFRKILLGVLAILIISQAIYSVLRLGPGFGMIGSRNQDYVFSISEVISHPLNPFIGNAKTTLVWLWLLLTPPAVAAIFLAFFNKDTLKGVIMLLLASLLPLIAQAAVAKVYTSRYILFAVDLLIPITAVGMYWLARRKGLLLKLLSTSIVIIPALVTLIYIVSPVSAPMPFDMRNGYLEEWTAGWGQKEIADYAINLEKKDNKVVIFTEGYFGTLPDGLQIYTEGHKNIIIVGTPPSVNHLPEALLNTSKENKIFMVMNKSRNHLPATDLSKLQLIAEYPKSVRADGSREYLQFFEYK